MNRKFGILATTALLASGTLVPVAAEARIASNKLAANRISFNKLAANRISANKLAANGVAANWVSAPRIVSNRAGDGSVDAVTAVTLPAR